MLAGFGIDAPGFESRRLPVECPQPAGGQAR
jgi:hypothetical protein